MEYEWMGEEELKHLRTNKIINDLRLKKIKVICYRKVH